MEKTNNSYSMTTEQLFDDFKSYISLAEGHYEYMIDEEDFKKSLIEFAKHHVEQALLKVANSDMDAICSWSGNPYTSEGSDSIDFDKVMKIYPLENLK